ncbi:MAG: lytic transglycosylase domain-containing protein [Acidobacteria bacterium]|nr:lytic transglycosylase domain-containing protein [Acidobacteriota bacterium]
MRSPMRWLTLAVTGFCLVLVQAFQYQATELDELRRQRSTHYGAIAAVEAELESLRIETNVRDVLDANNINVPRHKHREIARSIIEVSRQYDLQPELILAMIFTESRFDVHAESEAGAIGLMQLRPATARAVADELQLEWKGQRLLTDPQINILLGTSYLYSLLQRYDKHGLDYALAAYNVGPTKFDALLLERGRAPARYARQVRQVTEDLRQSFFDERRY